VEHEANHLAPSDSEFTIFCIPMHLYIMAIAVRNLPSVFQLNFSITKETY